MLDFPASRPSSAGSPLDEQLSGARAEAPARATGGGSSPTPRRRARPPRVSKDGAAISLGLPPGTSRTALVAALARVSLQSDMDAVAASSPGGRAEALLTAETARALHALLCDDAADGSDDQRFDGAAGGSGDAASWDASALVARMRSWLATRAATDPAARRAAGLCEQVAEALSVP